MASQDFGKLAWPVVLDICSNLSVYLGSQNAGFQNGGFLFICLQNKSNEFVFLFV